MEEERRLVRAQNAGTPTSGSPASCGCVCSKATLSKPCVASSTATPPKRILPKSTSDDLEVLQKTAAKVDSVVASGKPASIQPSGSVPSAHFMLMSPNTSQVESSVIVLPSPIVSSRPVGQVIASPTVLHSSRPSNQTILLLPAADQTVCLPQLKTVPVSAAIRNLSFTDGDVPANVLVPGGNNPVVHRVQNAVDVAVKTCSSVSVGMSVRMSVAGTVQHENAANSTVVPLSSCGSKVQTQASRGIAYATASLTGTVLTTSCVTSKPLSQTALRSQPTHKSTAASATSSSSSSKTVMSLLRANNGHEWKSYMKDSRPVASLLREEREKQQLQLAVPSQFATVQTIYQPVAFCEPLPSSGNFTQLNLWNIDSESLSLKPAAARRSSFERPSSVSDMLNLAALSTAASEVPLTVPSSLSAGANRKRPRTASHESSVLSVASDKSFRVPGLDRTLNIDLIEKSALDDLLADSGLLSTIPKSEELKPVDIAVELDLDIAEPPPAKVSLVNRSAENMTLQQLQQATLSRKALREHCKQPRPDPNCPLLFAGRPVSTLGEPLSISDGLSVRDSRPNTVAAFWEPAVYRDGSSSVGSCDSQLPDFSAANTYAHFMPIQNLSEDVPSTSGLVRPMAKVPGNRLNELNVETGSELHVANAGSEGTKHNRGKQRKRFRHKSLNRTISQTCSGEQLTVLSDSGVVNFATERSDSPLSAEISDIIAIDQRLHFGFTDILAHASEETPSPYRSRSVPASVMLDVSLTDALVAEFASDGSLDILTGGTEPSCNSVRNATTSNDLSFWNRPARGDHLISGVSFRPLARNSGTVIHITSESKETDTVDVVTHTPPSSVNASPSFVFEPSQAEPVAVSVDTPTSMESTSVSDRFVEELFKEVCGENNAELLDWNCSS